MQNELDLTIHLGAMYGGLHGVIAAIGEHLAGANPERLAFVDGLIDAGGAFEAAIEIEPIPLVVLRLRCAGGELVDIARLRIPNASAARH